jgi:hypothetical protein
MHNSKTLRFAEIAVVALVFVTLLPAEAAAAVDASSNPMSPFFLRSMA